MLRVNSTVVATLLVSKWVNQFIANANYSYLYSYYIVFFAFAAYTFKKGTQHASYWGLVSLASLCLCMAGSTLLQAISTEHYFKYYQSITVDFSGSICTYILL
ncbi:hypothetical protein ACOBV8_21365 (plasmid) [Pseudoalteromonas espejiana]